MRQQVMRPYKRYGCHDTHRNDFLDNSRNCQGRVQQFKEQNGGDFKMGQNRQELVKTEENRESKIMENPQKSQGESQKGEKLSIIQKLQMNNKQILSKLSNIKKKVAANQDYSENSHSETKHNLEFEQYKKMIFEEFEATLSQRLFKMMLESEQLRENMFNRIDTLEKNVGDFMVAITTKLINSEKKIMDYLGQNLPTQEKKGKFEFNLFENLNDQSREDDELSERLQSPTTTIQKDEQFLKKSNVPKILIQDDLGIQQLKVQGSEYIPLSLQNYCYKIDEKNNLIDQEDNYILSGSGNLISLSGSQLEKIRSQGLIQFVDK